MEFRGLSLILVVLLPCFYAADDATASTDEHKSVSKATLEHPAETIAMLQNLIDYISQQTGTEVAKRGFDGGYGGRFSAASSYGDRLLALQAAHNFNSPGRRRRDVNSFLDSVAEEKRGFDGGYGNRFSAASNYGSSLSALHRVSDFRSPGKRSFDGGYGGRFSAASANADRLMALQRVSDFRSPGKRTFDGGYGGRFSAASANADRLMALQRANDFRSPGKRSAEKAE